LQVSLAELAKALEPLGLIIVNKEALEKQTADVVLYEYASYDEYRQTQIAFNKLKIDKVWADEETLRLLAHRVQKEFPVPRTLKALCHGTRNGFEQNFLAQILNVDIVGTDISETALDFPRSVQWDFHDQNLAWIGIHDFVYSNSLDQSWKPKNACQTWLDQLRQGGLLILEHTPAGHSPAAAGKMDPFGAKPSYMPFLLASWFGHQISIEIIKSMKSNWAGKDLEVYLFIIKKLVDGPMELMGSPISKL
jgi:hypothetical protein